MTDKIQEIRQRPNERLIAHIENLLKNAKTGDIQSMVEVVIFKDGATANGCSISDVQMLRASIIVAELHMAIIRLSNHDTGIYSDIEYLKGGNE